MIARQADRAGSDNEGIVFHGAVGRSENGGGSKRVWVWVFEEKRSGFPTRGWAVRRARNRRSSRLPPTNLDVGHRIMKTYLIPICMALLALLSGCSNQTRVLFTFWSGEHAVYHVASVNPDGTFNSEKQWSDQADIFRGSVTQGTGGLYRVHFLHEGRRYVGNTGEYEYNSYTNAQYLRLDEKKILFAWTHQGENRDTSLMLKKK